MSQDISLVNKVQYRLSAGPHLVINAFWENVQYENLGVIHKEVALAVLSTALSQPMRQLDSISKLSTAQLTTTY